MDPETARRKALDPATPAAELRDLVATQARAVRLLVAENPNAPLDLLLLLARRYPERVVRNPSLGLHLLLQPDLLRQAPPHVAASLAACATTPPTLLGLLAEDPRTPVRLSAAQNPSCPPELLARLCADSEPSVRERAVRNAAAPPEVRSLLGRAGADEALRAASPRGPLPEHELQQLAELGPWAQELAARNPGCPPALLQRLGGLAASWRFVLDHPAASDELKARIVAWRLDHISIDLASHPGLPAEALRRIAEARGSDRKFAQKLLDHPALDAATAHALAAQHMPFHPFAEWLAGRPQSDEWTLLLALSTHPHWAALPDKLLARSDLTEALWQKLARHGLPELRLRVAQRREAPEAALRWMTGDLDANVRQAAWAHPSLPDAWRSLLLRLGFAAGLASPPRHNQSVPPDDLGALLDGGPWLRSFVAQHRFAPVALLERLIDEGDEAHDDDQGVSLRLSLRHDLPPELLRRLLPRLRAVPLLRLVTRPDPAPFVIEHVLACAPALRPPRGAELLAALAHNATIAEPYRDAALAAAERLKPG